MKKKQTQPNTEVLMTDLFVPNYSVRKLNTWFIGGTVERFAEPHSVEHLVACLQHADSALPVHWLGLGSNVLFPDGCWEASLIRTRKALLDISQNGNKWCVEAGVSCAKFARKACQVGQTDAAFFSGVPGTIGGALAMNAGAFGGETWNYVTAVDVVNRRGDVFRLTPEHFTVLYRKVIKPEEQLWFLRAYFEFPDCNDSQGLLAIKQLLRKRKKSQPIGWRSCGSVFKNPENDYAARLIDSLNLKGYSVGDAQISTQHANFIINQGQARAKDVLTLIQHIQKLVKEKCGKDLEPEVIVWE